MKLIIFQGNYLFKILVCGFLLTACSSATPEIQSVPTIAIPTKTIIPTTLPTETPTPIPTPTEFVIPDYAQAFFDGGYDTKIPNRPNSQYMIIRNNMRKSFDNLTINGVRVVDVNYGVGYIENGVFYTDGIIINTAVREVAQGKFWTSISCASSIRISSGIPSTVWIEGIMRGFDDGLPGDSDIVVALLGQGHENQGDRDKIFGNFFEGNVKIPGVKGKVLYVQNYFFNAYEQP